MSELKAELQRIAGDFTAQKEAIEHKLEHLKEDLEAVPAQIRAQIEKYEKMLSEIHLTTTAMNLVHESEDHLKALEARIKAALHLS